MRTNAKALTEVFGVMPRSRVALETGTHSPWIIRLLSGLGHEVIVAHATQGAADRGEPEERRPAGCADAGAVDPDRSATTVSGKASQPAGTSRSDGNSSASGSGAGAYIPGEYRTQFGQEVGRTLTGLQRAQYEN